MDSISSEESIWPVGLQGELMMIAFVLGVRCSRRCSKRKRYPSALLVSTGTGTPPTIVVIDG